MRSIRFDIEDLVVEKKVDDYDQEYTVIQGYVYAREVEHGQDIRTLAEVEFHADKGSHGYSVKMNELGPMEFEYLRIHIYTTINCLQGRKFMWMGELINEEIIEQVTAYKMNLL